MRAYLPSGDGSRGLGTDHASLEPALLLFRPITERLTLEAENMKLKGMVVDQLFQIDRLKAMLKNAGVGV